MHAADRHRRPFSGPQVSGCVEAHQSTFAHVLQASMIGTCLHSGIVETRQKALSDFDTVGQMRAASLVVSHVQAPTHID